MALKKIKYVLPAEPIDMGGFPVLQALPTQRVDQVDPFLLLHHANVKYSDLRPARTQGVGPHPHRGFNPVTFVIQGEVHHRDSLGNSQIAKAGDVQWVSAGRGIIHSERPSESLAKQRGRQEIVQLWINTPAQYKMDPAVYQYLSHGQIPSFTSIDRSIHNKVVAGAYDGLKGQIVSSSDLLILWMKAHQQGRQTISIPAGMNSLFYLISGEMKISQYGLLPSRNLAICETQGEDLEVVFEQSGEGLLLAGTPLQEKVVQSGPFVMNTQTEILQAMRDHQMGKMGVLIEE